MSSLPVPPSSRTAASEAELPADAVEVGRILDAYGVKGWFKVQSHSNTSAALLAAKRWFLRTSADQVRRKTVGPAAAAQQVHLPDSLKIVASRDHGDMVVAQAEGIGDRDAAEALRGAAVLIARSAFPPASAGEYYWVDLIGLEVVNLEGDALGTVAGLIDTGPHSVIRVAPLELPPGQDAEEAERLIPFVDAYVQDVSIADRRIKVDWGLDY